MPPTPRRLRTQSRAAWARTNASFAINDPEGFPSAFPPVWWVGSDALGAFLGNAAPASALAVVTRANALITGPLTSAPFKVQTQGTLGQKVQAPRFLTDPMLLRPDDRFSPDVYPAALKLPRSEFWAQWIRSAIQYGEGAFLTQLDEAGLPLAGTLKLVDSSLLATERAASDNSLRWVLGADARDEERAVFDRDGHLMLGDIRYCLVILRNPHSSISTEGRSQGVFEMSPASFQLGGQVDNYASGTFRNGVPNGYLKVNQPGLTPESAAALKTAWMTAHGNDQRSIAVLNATTDFTPISLSPVDAALGEVKRLNIADVAFAYGLDPMTLGASMQNSATYTNLRDAWSNHRDFGLAPWIAAVQDVLSALLPGAQGVAVNLDGFANPSEAERYASYKVAIDAGILTKDEVRELEGWPPLPEAEEEPPALPPTVEEPVEPESVRSLRVQR